MIAILSFGLSLVQTANGQGFAQIFQLLKAEYGADNKWLDVTERLQNLVRGQGVAFRVDGATLTDPLPGVQKTIRIRYLFRGHVRTDSFGDLADVRVGNPGTSSEDPSPGDLKVIRAEYGAGNRWADVTTLLQRKVTGNTLHLAINNSTMAIDPAPATPKMLRIEYAIGNHSQTLNLPENSQVSLPDARLQPRSSALTILEALYGAQGRRNNVEGPLNLSIRADRLNLVVNSANMGGDPFPGQSKELYVRYSWQGREFENFSKDQSIVLLPNSTDRLASGR